MIDERHSVRSYLDRPIELEKMTAIREEMERINKLSGLNISFLEDSEKVFRTIRGKLIGWSKYPSYCLALVGDDDDLLEEKCGYYGEQLVLYLQSLGLNTCWVGGFNKGEVRASLGPGQRLALTVAAGYGADQGKSRKSKSMSDLTDVTDMPEWFKNGMDAAMKAPTAINQQKFFVTLEDGKPVIKKKGRGPFIDVDLGIVKYHFEAGSGVKVAEY